MRFTRFELRHAGVGAAALMAFGIPAPAGAQGTLMVDGRAATVESLTAGQQLVLDQASGPQIFAGQEINLEAFTGVLGYSSVGAYVLVIDGRAELDGKAASSGEMLLLAAGSAGASVAPFDAARFAASWPAGAHERLESMHARLEQIAERQGIGLFIGRLGRTSLNVVAPGGAKAEVERRNLTGDPIIQELRFRSDGTPSNRARQVASTYLAALESGDTRTLAALTDPVPYGNAAMTDDAADGRLAMAQVLATSRPWRTLLAGATLAETSDAGRWSLTGPALAGTLLLRPMGDFVFVQGIELGDGQ